MLFQAHCGHEYAFAQHSNKDTEGARPVVDSAPFLPAVKLVLPK